MSEKKDKWEGCPYKVEEHEKALKNIALGIMPDPFGRGYKYHTGYIQMAYTWLKEKKELDMLKGIY